MTEAHEEIDAHVRVYGSRVHNLRGVDVSAPRNAFVVFTGVSGSGKSSLAFGTIYAEAQRRYFESVAPYARRLLLPDDAPKVDDITGLPPAVALQQRRGTATSRSTVGTVTTLSNLLRMLFSRAGTYPAGATVRLDSDAFSSNTSVGACPECHGLGRIHRVTEDTLVPDPSLTIREGAVAAWPGAWQGQNLRDILITLGYDIDKPWHKMPKRQRNWILFTDEQPTVEIDPSQHPVTADYYYNGTFSSAERHVRHTLANSQSATMRRRVLQYVDSVDCPECRGSGLRPEALAVTFAGHTIADMVAMPLTELSETLGPAATRTEFEAAYESLESGEHTEVATMIAADLVARIGVLIDLGLGYLSLHRRTPTVSPGELQRLRLATQLRAGLFGVLYVLDEPSAGLHPADAEPLLAVLDKLRGAGNSLFVVEHDMDVVRRADWVVDVGPGAGELGGEVLYSGPVAGLAGVEASITRRHLFADGAAATRSPRASTEMLRLQHISFHNLRDVSVELPLGTFIAVTGVSGSGKSTLVCKVLGDVVARHLGGRAADTADADAEPDGELLDIDADASVGVTVEGVETISRLVIVDQKPIGRTPRSNLATYTGLFDAVRKAFADTPAARRRGWSAGRFSFNVAEGRCETCAGEGFVAVELLFLPGTYATCPTCAGARYSEETLKVRYRDHTIADVLAMTVEEAHGFLADIPSAARSLTTLREVGLGYLRLGQPATELSGGEAQRIKLATELQRARRGHTLYVLDEPTTGLHPADVEQLERQLHRLVDAGNTVVVAEHDMGVVAGADLVIDLGPGGGDAGGRVVATGTPGEVAAAKGSRTAPYLAACLGHQASRHQA
ncbi:excinuclease ABC subunit UvrA [Mycolicibacterium confluentis]|uniref:UvrABC system protein A n=1 Tax=Mycolicibacterium confluentis TaxID=28047 RepID=A0A7I7XVF1_9MYCO|nr:excinuclease ABC subunit UvrA [Mycolicibacterium confluentis]MCV7317914.1 excinuclease ABC subunit UvrA [Mycolicibacterium confluentis]ORV22932.1 ABC transporter [Mycolicibacterium confluentis]BBZ33228.1 excinuclease ABC subunit A [Mycolicibacterium confluentis]